MDEPRREKPNDSFTDDGNDIREPGDMADAAQRQMPGQPPLIIDPAKRAVRLAHQAEERDKAIAEELRSNREQGKK